MPVRDVIERIYLQNYEKTHMSSLSQDASATDYGMHNISLVERANMLGLMQNWMQHHERGETKDAFLDVLKDFTRPLHSRKGKQALEEAAQQARDSGDNPLLAQIRKAAQLRAQRANLFEWEKKDEKNFGSLALNRLEKDLEAVRKGNLKSFRKFGNQYTEGLVSANDPKPATVTSMDSNSQILSTLQACMLDALVQQYGDIRLLFTTGKLVGGTDFLRVLASSMTLYQLGFIMNPNILRSNAPAESTISWDIRLNDFFLHAGIMRGAAFVFVTPRVTYDTFLDPKTAMPDKLAMMLGAPVGSVVPGLGGYKDKNFPVKPGGSEVLTLLEFGYGLDPQPSQFCKDVDMGFVMVPGRGGGRRKEHFLQMHSTFTREKYDRLIAFSGELAKLGLYS